MGSFSQRFVFAVDIGDAGGAYGQAFHLVKLQLTYKLGPTVATIGVYRKTVSSGL